MQPIEIACPTCAAQPGQPCLEQTEGCGIQTVMEGFHAERLDGARFVDSLTNRDANPGEEMPVTDKVLEETGLF